MLYACYFHLTSYFVSICVCSLLLLFLLLLREEKITFSIFSRIDSAFTERIMGLPIENYKAYVEADATQRVRNIPNDAFFLIHGLADATTPYHHSVQLTKALTAAGKIFRYTVSMTLWSLFSWVMLGYLECGCFGIA